MLAVQWRQHLNYLLMKKHSKEYLQNLTPYQGYELLVEGNKRFINNLQNRS